MAVGQNIQAWIDTSYEQVRVDGGDTADRRHGVSVWLGCASS